MERKYIWKGYLFMALGFANCFSFGGGGGDCGHEDPINPADLTIVETEDAIDGRSVRWAAVANSRFDSVTLVDLNTFDYRNVAVGEYPQAIVSNGDAGWVATANRGSDDISIIYLDDFRVDTVAMGEEPFDILAQRNRANLWVANRGEGSVTVLDTFTYAVETLTGLSGVARLVQSESGRTIYALAPRFGELFVIDAESVEIREVRQIGFLHSSLDLDFRTEMRITADGRYLVIADAVDSRIHMIDLQTGDVSLLAIPNFQPSFVSLLSDSETAFVSGRSDRWVWDALEHDIVYFERPGNNFNYFGRMLEIDIATGELRREFVLDGLPQGGLVSRDGSRFYSPIYDSFQDPEGGDRYSEILAFDLESHRRWVLRVASYPWKIGLAGGDNLLVVTHGNPLGGLTIIDARTMETVFYRAGMAVGDK